MCVAANNFIKLHKINITICESVCGYQTNGSGTYHTYIGVLFIKHGVWVFWGVTVDRTELSKKTLFFYIIARPEGQFESLPYFHPYFWASSLLRC